MKRKIARSIVWSVGVLLLTSIACLGEGLVLSEIAWGGTAASSSDEWIEIRNDGDAVVTLAGWRVAFGDVVILLGEVGEDTVEARASALEPGAFLLLERTDDTTVSDVVADVIYKGSLSNAGVAVELLDPDGQMVDSVNPGEDAWPAGGAADADVAYCTMERGANGEWGSNDGTIRNGLDADGAPLNGTPGQINSLKILVQRAPHVHVTHPSVEGEVLSGITLVSWTASDPDGDDAALSIALRLSTGDGEWDVLIENLANTGSYAWDTGGHAAGEDYRLSVQALDAEGYAGADVSPVFSIE